MHISFHILAFSILSLLNILDSSYPCFRFSMISMIFFPSPSLLLLILLPMRSRLYGFSHCIWVVLINYIHPQNMTKRKKVLWPIEDKLQKGYSYYLSHSKDNWPWNPMTILSVNWHKESTWISPANYLNEVFRTVNQYPPSNRWISEPSNDSASRLKVFPLRLQISWSRDKLAPLWSFSIVNSCYPRV